MAQNNIEDNIHEVNEMDNISDNNSNTNSDLDLESLDSFDGFNEYDLPMSPHANLYNSDIDIADIDTSDLSFSDSNLESKNENNDQGDEETPIINPEWTKEYSNFNVPEFIADTGPLLPHDFPDTSEATPIDYFKLYLIKN